jgi:hypothetical protein
MMKFFAVILLLFLIISLPGTARGWSEEKGLNYLDRAIEAEEKELYKKYSQKLDELGIPREILQFEPFRLWDIWNCVNFSHSFEQNKLNKCVVKIFGQPI